MHVTKSNHIFTHSRLFAKADNGVPIGRYMDMDASSILEPIHLNNSIGIMLNYICH